MELKMIIVDDEPVICKGLRLTIPWHELGVRVVGEAHNGKQALRLAEKHDVDLVLTDVKMPEMDGLALAEALRRERPQVRIVMISGYDEFEYARQALRLGVEDYLLKPVDIDELWQLVKRLAHERRKELDEEREEQKEALTRWVMSQILSLPAPETGRKERYFRRVRGFWLCVSQLDAYAELERQLTETERKDLENKWQRLVIKELSGAHMTAGETVSFFTHPNCHVAVCLLAGTLDGEKVGKWFARRLERICEAWDGPSRLCFGVAGPYGDLSLLNEAYGQALTALKNKVSDGDHCIFFHGADSGNGRPAGTLSQQGSGTESENRSKGKNRTGQGRRWIDLREAEKVLMEALLQNDAKALTVNVDALFERLRIRHYSLEEALSFCRDLRYLLELRLREFFTRWDGEGTESIFLTGNIDLHRYNTFSLLKQLFHQDVLRLAQKWPLRRGRNHWLVKRAKEYIEEHFHQDLRASDVAGFLHITPNYFSTIFKQETGKSFCEYVSRLRVEKAKELLANTSFRVFEIAEEVGYKEYKYFAQVFKKLTGVTPTEYRERLLAVDQS